MNKQSQTIWIAMVGIIFMFTIVFSPDNALANQTPDVAIHPEVNEHLWTWMDSHFIDLYNDNGKPNCLDHNFFSTMIEMMESDGFTFSEYDKSIYANSTYPESQLARWSMHYFCTTLIGPYIEWTIHDQYAFFSLMRRAEIVTDDYGYPPADPQLTTETPSNIYEAAKKLAYDTYGFSDDDLSQYDVLIEFQAFRHPVEPPHERWSVLWCSYHDSIDKYFLVVTYIIQEERWSIALFD